MLPGSYFLAIGQPLKALIFPIPLRRYIKVGMGLLELFKPLKTFYFPERFAKEIIYYLIELFFIEDRCRVA